MASVPGILVAGDLQVNGGSPGLASALLGVSSLLQSFTDQRVLRIVPSNDDTGAPTASTLGWFPWFDASTNATINVAASATSTTVTVTPDPGWTTNQWIAHYVTIVNPLASFYLGFQARAIISANTSDTLTVSSWNGNGWPGGTPVAGQFVIVGKGRWTDYHPVAGWMNLTEIGGGPSRRGGSSYTLDGAGVGYDAGLMRTLQAIYPVAPYFQLSKLAQTYPTVSGWGVTGHNAQVVVTDWFSRMDTAWAELGTADTLDWDLVIFDNSQQDVVDWSSNPTNYLLYEERLTAAIAFFRTATGNPDLKVILVNHDPELQNVTRPGFTGLANQLHRIVALQDPLVRVCSLEGLRLAGANPSYGVENTNRAGYAKAEYWGEAAERLTGVYKRMLDGVTPTEIDGAFPCYLFIGDSIAVGTMSEAYALDLGSYVYTPGTRSDAQQIFNDVEGRFEPYDLTNNSNTNGTINGSGGPEFSLLVALEQRHPDGFGIIKRGVSGSTLIVYIAPYSGGATGGRWSRAYAGSEHFGYLQTLFRNAQEDAFSRLNKQLDLLGVFVTLGTNDGAVLTSPGAGTSGALFAGEVANFVADLRQAFSTRTSGPSLPIIWRKPQLDYSTARVDEIVQIREALEEYALSDSRFALVDCDDLQRLDPGDLHDTPASVVTAGERFAAALATVDLDLVL